MASARVERRLAAILAADVLGYTRLVQRDEQGTLDRVKAHREELIEPLVAEHGGRIVKLMGDGILCEFTSAVHAVACAVAIQRGMAEREAKMLEEQRIRFRIGINVGDVVHDGGDILGDGVNLAARLQTLAEPGGVLLARNVHDQVRDKLAYRFEPVGHRRFKNIAQPVEVWRVASGEAVALRFGRRRWSRLAYAASALLLLVAVGSASLWYGQRVPLGTGAPPPAGKPAIAVLPFANLSNDADQEWFVDGMTEDVITDLSMISGLAVIARNSVFTYKGRPTKAQEIARDLNVSHILEGSVRRAGDQVRVNVQLIDAGTGRQLWAARFDAAIGNIFALQDQITRKIISGLSLSLTRKEEDRLHVTETVNIQAYELFLKGRERYRRFTPEDLAAARDYIEKALELDPSYGRAHAALAEIYYRAFDLGWAQALGLGWNRARLQAGQHLLRAWDNPTPLAHRVASEMYLRAKRTDDALRQAELALALDPNDPENLVAVARSLVFLGREEEAIELIDRAMRLEIHYPGEYMYLRGLANFGMGKFAEAASEFRDALKRDPDSYRIKAPLAAAYYYLGQEKEARAAFDSYLAAEGEVPMAHTGELSEVELWLHWPYKYWQDWDRLGKGLAKAGGRALEPPYVKPADPLSANPVATQLD